MAKSKENSPFNNQDEVLTNHPAEIPFEVALLALGNIPGLGHKRLQLLVNHFEDNLGMVFSLSYEDIKHLLSNRKIGISNKIAFEVSCSPKGLIEKR